MLPIARRSYLTIVEKLRGQVAEGVILGSTEIPLLISPKDTGLLLFNTTAQLADARAALEVRSFARHAPDRVADFGL